MSGSDSEASCVTFEDLNQLSQQLDVSVSFDEIGWLHDGVELCLESWPDGTVRLVSVTISRDMTLEGILLCDIRRLCDGYNIAVRKLRALPRRLRAIVIRELELHKPGSTVWRSHETLMAVDEMLSQRQMTFLGQGIATPATLGREIEYYERIYTHHANVADSAELLEAERTSRPTSWARASASRSSSTIARSLIST